MEILLVGYALWFLGRLLCGVGRGIDTQVEADRRAQHGAKCELAALVADEPEHVWQRYGLDKQAMLRDCRDRHPH